MMIVEPSKSYARSHRNTVPSRIAKVVEKHYDKYGIWPSVAIGQAFVESGLYSGGHNLFGVRRCSGLSVEEATERYLQCLQNQYFRGEANFAPTPEQQLAIIMRGGRYCARQYPGGSYYRDVINSIDNHNWRSFDEHIKRKIKKKEAKKRRKKRQKQPFRIIFDSSLPEGTAIVDPEYIKKGSTIVFQGGIVEVTETDKKLNDTIIFGKRVRHLPRSIWNDMVSEEWPPISNIKIKLQEVIEDAKG